MGEHAGHPFRGNQYIAGQKYYQAVPEITHLPATLIRKQHDDDREVSSVSDETARSIERSAKAGTLPPIDITVFASGEVIVDDGHHRLAAAKQLGFDLPVNVSAINARGEKLNELIQASHKAVSRSGWTAAKRASGPREGKPVANTAKKSKWMEEYEFYAKRHPDFSGEIDWETAKREYRLGGTSAGKAVEKAFAKRKAG